MTSRGIKNNCIISGLVLLITFIISAYAVASEAAHHKGKTIVHVDSYHEGYEWSDGIVNGIRSVLKDTGVQLKIFRMDTKRNASEDFKIQAGMRARDFIEEVKPDVVIVSDDNASKYLAKPYLKDSDIPVVFCGVNWDETTHGYPYKNSTGMVEVDPVGELVPYFDRFTEGKRYGYLAGDTYSDTIITDNWNQRFFDGKMKVYLAKSLQEFKEFFLKAQKEVDRLIINNNVGIPDWDQDEAVRFVVENTVIPTSTTNHWIADMTLFAGAKLPEEQGAWSAEAALKILGGTPAPKIPMVTNKMAVLTINLPVANRLGVLFDLSDLQKARIIR